MKREPHIFWHMMRYGAGFGLAVGLLFTFISTLSLMADIGQFPVIGIVLQIIFGGVILGFYPSAFFVYFTGIILDFRIRRLKYWDYVPPRRNQTLVIMGIWTFLVFWLYSNLIAFLNVANALVMLIPFVATGTSLFAVHRYFVKVDAYIQAIDVRKPKEKRKAKNSERLAMRHAQQTLDDEDYVIPPIVERQADEER
ncbi:MAG: hypothetical protein AAFQ07_06755 [Chloroflexota bacterium]